MPTYNRHNYYYATRATFHGVARPPKGGPDFVSYNEDGKVSSMYWYTDKGVYRKSSHWSAIYIDGSHSKGSNVLFCCGKVASCYWALKTTKPTTIGFAKWTSFSRNKRTAFEPKFYMYSCWYFARIYIVRRSGTKEKYLVSRREYERFQNKREVGMKVAERYAAKIFKKVRR